VVAILDQHPAEPPVQDRGCFSASGAVPWLVLDTGQWIAG
jgi:hypothetical protein